MDLPLSDLRRLVRVEGGKRPTGTAAQTLIVQGHQLDIAAEHLVYRSVPALRMSEVARIVDRHHRAHAAGGSGGSRSTCSASTVWMSTVLRATDSPAAPTWWSSSAS